MSWKFPWSEFVKKRACRYLLQYYLGHFLKEKLTLEQLSVDLYNGTGKIRQLDLDVEVYLIPFFYVVNVINDNSEMYLIGIESKRMTDEICKQHYQM